jgi:hypothetical protein
MSDINMPDLVDLRNDCNEALLLALQILQARSGQNADARTWQQVLMYAPEATVLACADRIRLRQHRAARRIAR